MKPFVLIATRAEDAAADPEFALVEKYGGFEPGELIRWQLDRHEMPSYNLDDLSGIIVGGSPFNTSDDESVKSSTQRRVEAEMSSLLDEVVERDFPFLGACYGVGTLGRHEGATIDRTHSEPVSAVEITLTEAGVADPLLAGVQPSFYAMVGHKEAISTLPPHATLLATSVAAPVQMFKIKENLYATQFHPELDLPGVLNRIDVYKDHGYFPDGAIEQVRAQVKEHSIAEAQKVLRNFVKRYAR
ncbi:MAG: glutamine amidotransferase [Cellulomonadaceae bacterium]|jgi:GMP synthase (glutamine-hydrolysing)|nr:glutamine amidotransferase [Cellulomonadaceae bacterium]